MKWIFILFLSLVAANCTGQTYRRRGDRTDVSADFIFSSQGVYYLRESGKKKDISYNGYQDSLLKAIRKNFKYINSIPNQEWSSVVTKNLEGSAEAGLATFYSFLGTLHKIVVRYYGETSQKIIEYYLMKGKLSFVLEKEATYNRPINYDAAKAKEQNDTVAFNINKSEITEDRYYFKDDNLQHMISSQDCGAPFSQEALLEEQKRILTDFESLLNLSKEQ